MTHSTEVLPELHGSTWHVWSPAFLALSQIPDYTVRPYCGPVYSQHSLVLNAATHE